VKPRFKQEVPMRSIFWGELRYAVAPLLALAVLVPVMSGCSTLGIATTEDLTALENRLQSSNNSTSARLDNLEQEKTDLQSTLTQISADIDTLNNRFARASEWLKNMNLDTISQDAQDASQAAMNAESRSRAFLAEYLEWVKAQHAMLEEQIATLEAHMQKEPADTETPTEPPADSGSDDTSSDDGGGGR
jgi:septal ring factor EnvC (AmiA/AmiB activator)